MHMTECCLFKTHLTSTASVHCSADACVSRATLKLMLTLMSKASRALRIQTAHVLEDDARDGVLPLHRRLQKPEQLPHQRRAL